MKMLHLFLSAVIAFTTPVYGADVIVDEPATDTGTPDTSTEAAGPEKECDACGARVSTTPDPIPIERDELIGRVEDVDRRETAKPASSFNWGPILALALGAGVGYLAYKAISSNNGPDYRYPPEYASQYPTYRTYQPPYMPGGSPFYTHYYGSPGYPPGILPYNGMGTGYPPGVLPYNQFGTGYQPYVNNGYNTSPYYAQNSFGIGSPYYGQATNLGAPPAILPMIASTASATASTPFCPTNNYFGTSIPTYNSCTL